MTPPARAAGISDAMSRYLRGEITAEDYVREIRKETAALVRRERRANRWFRW